LGSKIKEQLLRFCWHALDQRMSRLKKRSLGLQEPLCAETKSSVGNKHETGRAMVQLKMEHFNRPYRSEVPNAHIFHIFGGSETICAGSGTALQWQKTP